MMRPLRAFIMPRNTAFDSRNTEARLVCKHRVPVLLLHAQQQGVAGDAGIVAKNADGPFLGFDVLDAAHRSTPGCRRRARRRGRRARPELSLMRAAPSAVVAVPMTRAPSALKRSAMAAPMPREAPVTNAISPFNMASPSATLFRLAAPRRRTAGSSSASILRSRFLSMRRFNAVSTLPGPHSMICVAPAAIMVRTVAAQYTGVASCLTNPARISSGTGVDLDSRRRTPRCRSVRPPRVLSSRTRSFSAAGCMSEQCAGTLIGRCHRAPRTLGRGDLDGARHRRGVSRNHHLSRRIEIDRLDHLTLRSLLAGRFDVGVLETQDRRNGRPARCGTAACISSPRYLTRSTVVLKSRYPAATSALNSPRLWPAIMRGHGAAALAPKPVGRNAGRQHRRLGAFRRIEQLGGTLLAALPKIVAQDLAGLGKGRLDDRRDLCQSAHHADGLGSLAREIRMRAT